MKDIGNVTAGLIENKQKYPIAHCWFASRQMAPIVSYFLLILSLQKNVPVDLKPSLKPAVLDDLWRIEFKINYNSNLWLVFMSVLRDLDFQVIVNQFEFDFDLSLSLSLRLKMHINFKAVMNDLTLIW